MQTACLEQKVVSNNQDQLVYDLINQLISDENEAYPDFASVCILESTDSPMPPLPRMGNLTEFSIRELEVLNKSHIIEQVEAFRDFKIDKGHLDDLNLITEQDLRLYKISSNENSYWESLLLDCPNGYYFFSRPIFNEEFNKAIVNYGKMCGRLCGGGGTYIYAYINGFWVLEKEISSWVS